MMEWISVKDGLPPQPSKVMVWIEMKGNDVMWMAFFDGKNFMDRWEELYTVTHWMPLPEPPKTTE